jgi:hypothetical protein
MRGEASNFMNFLIKDYDYGTCNPGQDGLLCLEKAHSHHFLVSDSFETVKLYSDSKLISLIDWQILEDVKVLKNAKAHDHLVFLE